MRFGTLLLTPMLGVGLAGCGEAEPKVKPTPAPVVDAGPSFIPLDASKARDLPGGLKYEDLAVGDGSEATTGSTVDVHYTGWLTTGEKFDSSHQRGNTFRLVLGAGQVIKGWDQGLVGMKEGGKRKLQIPPALAYGEGGSPPRIPPSATLVFDVELVRVLPGVKIEDLKVGDGPAVRRGDVVTVHYIGTLTDGRKFDSSHDRNEPYAFQLGSRSVIAGWNVGVAGMKVGGKRKLTIPPEFAYGEEGMGNVIPPNSTLVFEVELLRVRAP